MMKQPEPVQEFRPTNLQRVIIITCLCIQTLSIYSARDNPQAIHKQIISALGIDDTRYMLLYAVYSIPNIIVSYIIGAFLKPYARSINIGLFALVIVGQALCVAGAWIRSYPLLIIGRIITGTGGENLIIVHAFIIPFYFSSIYALISGLNQTLGRVGNIINSFTSPEVYNATGEIGWPFLVGFFLQCGALLATVVLYSTLTSSGFVGHINKSAETDSANRWERLHPRHLKHFNGPLWCVIFISGMYYGIFLAYTNFAAGFLQDYFGLSFEEADHYTTVIYFVPLLGISVSALLLDRYGRRGFWFILSNVLGIAAFAVLLGMKGASNHALVVIPLVLFALYYSVYVSNLWSAIPLSSALEDSGAALGITSVWKSVLVSFFPLIEGAIKDANANPVDGYRGALIFILVLLGVNLCVSILLEYLIYGTDHKLNPSSKELAEIKAANAAKKKIESISPSTVDANLQSMQTEMHLKDPRSAELKNNQNLPIQLTQV